MASSTRELKLPHGGVIEIPLPGAGGKQVTVRPPTLADSGVCPHLAGTVIICLVIGAAVGAIAATAWANR